MAHTKLKVIQRSARKASRIVTSGLSAKHKKHANRTYRRRVRQTDHTAEDPVYEPSGNAKVTGWDVA